MRSLTYFGTLACLAVMLGGITSTPLMADPLGESQETPVFPDPVLNNNLVFPPGLATSGTADTGPKLSASPASTGAGCSALNPCAVVTPALDNLAAVPASTQSARPIQAMRKRARHSA
jgi:hypothetical protein